MKKKKAFTLAEILIALTVIGVISAITVPVLMHKYQKDVTVTQLKKTYSTLQQAFNRSIAENGPAEKWEDVFSLASADKQSAYYILKKYLYPYLSINKDCSTSSCPEYKAYSGGNLFGEASTNARFYLNDGTLVHTRYYNWTYTAWLNVHVDINGNKGPNKYGRDCFYFNVVFFNKNNPDAVLGQFRPGGADETRASILSCAASGYGCCRNSGFAAQQYCAALIMKDSWQISDDYPW